MKKYVHIFMILIKLREICDHPSLVFENIILINKIWQ